MSKRKFVLIIDDEEIIARLLASALSSRGLDVQTATRGAMGVTAAWRRPPDAVVLDVMMPEMDGFQVLNALRGDPRTERVPVLMVSAGFDPNYGLRAGQHGALFLGK